MMKLSGIQKEFQILNRSWININGSKTDDWKTFEENNPTIALNILYIKEKETCQAYIFQLN